MNLKVFFVHYSLTLSCISSTESETPARISGIVSQSSSDSLENSASRRRKTFIEMTPKNYVLFLTLWIWTYIFFQNHGKNNLMNGLKTVKKLDLQAKKAFVTLEGRWDALYNENYFQQVKIFNKKWNTIDCILCQR